MYLEAEHSGHCSEVCNTLLTACLNTCNVQVCIARELIMFVLGFSMVGTVWGLGSAKPGTLVGLGGACRSLPWPLK